MIEQHDNVPQHLTTNQKT